MSAPQSAHLKTRAPGGIETSEAPSLPRLTSRLVACAARAVAKPPSVVVVIYAIPLLAVIDPRTDQNIPAFLTSSLFLLLSYVNHSLIVLVI